MGFLLLFVKHALCVVKDALSTNELENAQLHVNRNISRMIIFLSDVNCLERIFPFL